MPLIGITMSLSCIGERWRHHCPIDYTQAVLSAGGCPILLPSEAVIAACPEIVAGFDGFLLSGGGDLDPALFGQQRHPATGEPDTARDEAELRLARLAIEHGPAVVGHLPRYPGAQRGTGWRPDPGSAHRRISRARSSGTAGRSHAFGVARAGYSPDPANAGSGDGQLLSSPSGRPPWPRIGRRGGIP